MSRTPSPRPVPPAAVPSVHLEEVNGTATPFDVLPLADAMNVHGPCVFVVCHFVYKQGVVVPVNLYLSHTTHLARTLADPQLQACLTRHGATHVRVLHEALSARRKAGVAALRALRGPCNEQLSQPSR
ncbi:MAG: hypothetical protein JNM62_03780 [Flavobacteriales bacterium]|nr:hypothetical protein [Flavobacteriales bacterium]